MVTPLISFIVKKLVDKPDVVTVEEVHVDGKALLQVRVSPHDLSRVIGSEARTFRALRTLVHLTSQDRKDLVVDSLT